MIKPAENWADLPCSETSRVQHDAEARMFGWYGDERLEFVSFFFLNRKNNMQLCKSFFRFFSIWNSSKLGDRSRHSDMYSLKVGSTNWIFHVSQQLKSLILNRFFLMRWLAWPLWLMTSYAMGLIIFRRAIQVDLFCGTARCSTSPPRLKLKQNLHVQRQTREVGLFHRHLLAVEMNPIFNFWTDLTCVWHVSKSESF